MKLDVYLLKEGLTQIKFCKINNINLGKLNRARRGDLGQKEIMAQVRLATNGQVNTFSDIAIANGKQWRFEVPISVLEDLATKFSEAKDALTRLIDMGGGKKVVVTLGFEDIQTEPPVDQGRA